MAETQPGPQLVGPEPLLGGEQVCPELVPTGEQVHVDGIVPGPAVGGDLVGRVPLGHPAIGRAVGGVPEVKDADGRQGDLILHVEEMPPGPLVQRGLDRAERRQAGVRRAKVVRHQAGTQGLPTAHLGLRPEAVIDRPVAVAILPARQLADEILLVEHVEGVEEPDTIGGQRAGQGVARAPVPEPQSPV